MKNKIKYIFLPAVILIIILVSIVNLDALNYTLSWGGNKAQWIYSDSNYMYPSTKIKMKAGDSLYYNGVAVTSGTGGGGISASDNTTFSGFNTFSGITRHTNGTYFTDSLNVTGAILKADSVKVLKNLLLGTTSKMYTVSNVLYSNETGYEWQNLNSHVVMTLDSATGLVIRKKFNSISDSVTTDSKFYFNDTIKTNSRFIATDLARFNDSLIMSSYDIFLPNGKGLNWGELTGQIYSNAGEMVGRSALFTNYTLYGNFLNSSDSANGFIVRKKLEGYADTITSASKWEFSDLVSFATTVTFTVSPVFSALVNFANGLTTTTLTASGTATFNGDLVPTWVKNNSSVNAYKYEKIKVVGMKLSGSVATTTTAAHGISDWRSILSYTVTIRDDSSKCLIIPNVYSDDVASAGKWFNNANIDSLNCRLRVSVAGVNLVNDSAFFRIIYYDRNR